MEIGRRSLSFPWTFARRVWVQTTWTMRASVWSVTHNIDMCTGFFNQSITCLHILVSFSSSLQPRDMKKARAVIPISWVWRTRPRRWSTFSKKMAMAGPGLRPPDPVLFLCHQTECQQGSDCRTPSLSFNSPPCTASAGTLLPTTAHGCQRLRPRSPGAGRVDLSLLCLQPGTPRPLSAPTPGVSAFREGGDRTNQAMGLAAASLLRAALSWRRAGWSPHVSSPVPRPSGSKASPGLSSSMRGSPCSLRMTLQERRTAVQG